MKENGDAEKWKMMGRERKMYMVVTVYHNISHPTVPITCPWWETYLTLPP
jgi:hypothetical protein